MVIFKNIFIIKFINYKSLIENFTQEAFIEWLNENKEKITHELNDSNFEHHSQAATGGTSGDWFVLL